MLTVDEESVEEKKSTGFPLGSQEEEDEQAEPADGSSWRHEFGPSEELTRRPSVMGSGESEELELPHAKTRVSTETDLKLMNRLHRRINRIAEKRPLLVENALNAIDHITEDLAFKISTEPQTLDVIMGLVSEEPKKTPFIFLSAIEDKIAKELHEGHFVAPTWEQETDALERRTKILEKRNDMVSAIFSREQIREMQQQQARKAQSFAVRMMSIARETEARRAQEIEYRSAKVRVEANSEQEKRIVRKMEQVDQHHDKAMMFIHDLHEKKRARINFFMEGRERQKKIMRIVPLHIQKDREYKVNEDLLYHSRGRSIKELEAFWKDQKQYHLQRNKLSILELIRPDSKITSRVTTAVNRSIDSVRITSSNVRARSRAGNRYLLKPTELDTTAPAIVQEEKESEPELNIQFAKLPAIKYAKFDDDKK